MRRLIDLKPGEQGRILGVTTMAKLLASLGFVPGTTVQVCQEIHGGPLLVTLGDSIYALGPEVAGGIVVEQVSSAVRPARHRWRWRGVRGHRHGRRGG